MRLGNSDIPFQQCRRRGAGRRLFLPLRLQTVEYLLRFTDGATERYQVGYTAGIEAEESRQRWLYRGHISRHLSIYNRAGERFEKADVDRRIELPPDVGQDIGTGDWYRWREYAFTREPSLMENEFEEIYQRLTRSFANAVVADKRRVEKHFRQIYKCVEAISEID